MTKNVLDGKNCLITGATGGIGKEIVFEIASKNCNLFLVGQKENKLKELKKEIQKTHNIKVEFCKANLCNLRDIKKIVKQSKNKFKTIDVLINTAGIFSIKSLNKSNLNEFEKMLRVNTIVPFLLAKEFSMNMVKKKWGRIVNLGSSSSYSGFKNGSMYCTTKHAILGLSRALQAELKGHNVRVFSISPGSTKTKMGKISIEQNFETFLNPREVAKVVVFLISFDNEMIVDEIRLNRIKIE